MRTTIDAALVVLFGVMLVLAVPSAGSAEEFGPSPASIVAEATGFVDCAEGLSADAASCPADVWLYAILDTVSQCLDGGADGADVHSVNCIYLGGGVWRYRVQATCTYNIF